MSRSPYSSYSFPFPCEMTDTTLTAFESNMLRRIFLPLEYNLWEERENSYTYLLTYLLTYCTERSTSWEANRFLASQEIPRILWNSKVHCRTHKCPPPVPILSQIDSVHTSISHFLKIHLNTIPLFKPGSPQWPLSLRFPHQIPVHLSPFPHTRYMPRPSHSSRFHHPHNIWWWVQITKLIIM